MGDTLKLAIIATGRYEDYHERIVFATFDGKRAREWAERFNGIIEANKERWDRWWGDPLMEDKELFWGEWYEWERPMAKVEEVEWR
jgi:restriction endonuclease Mrr